MAQNNPAPLSTSFTPLHCPPPHRGSEGGGGDLSISDCRVGGGGKGRGGVYGWGVRGRGGGGG